MLSIKIANTLGYSSALGSSFFYAYFYYKNNRKMVDQDIIYKPFSSKSIDHTIRRGGW